MKTGLYLMATLGLVAAAALPVQAEDVWTGGVGIAEREQAPNYNTRIECFVASGSYLAGIDYTLYNASGQPVAGGQTDGPWLRVQLPAGDYRIEAIRPDTGDAQSAHFTVAGGVTSVGLRFPD
ncbi:hypothetical protein [Saccharospirillum mangrovi]|uniref:hypothetical protein n=1 Tax=Saccharospirillum mangrovi TaxID=2161747 RepID=UPI000D36ED39|nr:hypothetical protein [Saccharospirillum mangrovi]